MTENNYATKVTQLTV